MRVSPHTERREVAKRVGPGVHRSNNETTGEDSVCATSGSGDHSDARRRSHPLRGSRARHARKRWRGAFVMRFKTDDRRYAWLNEAFARTRGTFDSESGMARFPAFVPK